MKDGALVVVDALSAGEIKTKAAVEMLKRLGADGKSLLIDLALDENLAKSVRNVPGVEFVASAHVNARSVMNAAKVIATRARPREAAGGAGMKLTDVIRRPLITEKTSILREDGRTIVFEVATGREQDRDQARDRAAVRQQGRDRPHEHRARQGKASGPLRRPPVGLEESLRPAARRREDA